MDRRSVIIGLGAVGLIAIGQLTSPGSARTGAAHDSPATVARTTTSLAEPSPIRSACERFEGDAVLDLVRSHRRGDADHERQALASTIVEESRAAGVDPLLVASIVASESSFRTGAVSRAGAVGLMQLRPFVARDVAGRVEVDWQGHDTLTTPSLNLRLGIVYYRELLERFDGDAEIALTAYNQGPTRVRGKLSSGRYRASEYAGRILARYGELAEARSSGEPATCTGAV